MSDVTTACSCRWLHTIVVYDPQCPEHTRPTTETSDADCAHVWDRVLTQEGTPTQRQCQRCGVIQSGSFARDAATDVRDVIEVMPDGKERNMLLGYAELLDGFESLKQQIVADEDAVVLEGIEAFVLMVSVIADQTVTRSFAQIAEDELVKLRERVATSART